MGPIWGRQNPGGPRVGPMNFAIWVCITKPQSGETTGDSWIHHTKGQLCVKRFLVMTSIWCIECWHYKPGFDNYDADEASVIRTFYFYLGFNTILWNTILYTTLDWLSNNIDFKLTNRHPISRPDGRTMRCHLCIFRNILTVLYRENLALCCINSYFKSVNTLTWYNFNVKGTNVCFITLAS